MAKHDRSRSVISTAINFFAKDENKTGLSELREAIASTQYRIQQLYERKDLLEKGGKIVTTTTGFTFQGPKKETKTKKFVDQKSIDNTWRIITENEKLLAELQGLLKGKAEEAVESLVEIISRFASDDDDES